MKALHDNMLMVAAHDSVSSLILTWKDDSVLFDAWKDLKISPR